MFWYHQDDHDDDDDEVSDADSYSDIKEYFEDDYFQSLSSYEKKSYRNMKRNYEVIEKEVGKSFCWMNCKQL